MHSDSGDGADAAAPAAQTPAAQAPADPAELAAVLAELQAVRRQLGVLTDREHERASHRESVIDRLHTENQSLRRNELETVLEPVRLGLYRVYDLARREGARWSGDAPPATEHAGPLLTAIAAEVAEVLERTGIQPYEPARGEPYDPVRHRPVETADVTENSLHGAVVQVLNCGFTHGETIARRADVVVGQPAGDGAGRPSRKKSAGRGARGAGPPAQQSAAGQQAAAEQDAAAARSVNGMARARDND